MTKIDDLTNVIGQELKSYSREVTDSFKKETKKSMKKLVKKTKDTAPVGKREKHYRDSISSKKLRETETALSMVWYVKGSDYRLSHLLNNGYATRNGSRVHGTDFIGKAEREIVEEYEKNIEEVIKNGRSDT